jgi:hypothetical protein
MYCHYCGRPAAGSCSACGHRVCADHCRTWLFVAVCKKCYGSMWAAMATLAVMAAGVAAIYYLVVHY